MDCGTKKRQPSGLHQKPNRNPAQHPQGVGRIRKAAEPPTAAHRLQFREEGQGNGAERMAFLQKNAGAKRTLLRRGAEGGIRTPARFYPPTPLAGEPLIATWVLLHGCKSKTCFILGEISGGESGIRTHGSCESLVFKTSSLNHSDISPDRPPIRDGCYLTIQRPICQGLRGKNIVRFEKTRDRGYPV